MTEKTLHPVHGPIYHRFFSNGSPNPAGSLISAGMGVPSRQLSWWDVRSLSNQPYYGLVMLLGDGVGFYRDENSFQCELAKGYFFLTFPDHKLDNGPLKGQLWGELYVGFSGDIFKLAQKRKIIGPKQPVWKLEDPMLWVERLQALLQSEPPRTQQQDFRRAIHFFHFLLDMLEAAQPIQNNPHTSDWFDLACQAITSDLHHPTNWEELAITLGMSYHTFRQYFRRRAGMSPMQYREKHRFELACNLLANAPHHSCQDIAFVLGYTSPDHFSEQFKKRFGMSPLNYRKQHRNKIE